MSGNGCSCSSTPEAPSSAAPASNPCGSGSQHTVPVWQTLALGPNAVQVSAPFSARGGNALSLIITTIAGSGAIQNIYQVQISDEGTNWSNFGASGQATTVGYTVIGPLTGNSAAMFRVVVAEQAGSTSISTVMANIYCA